MASKNEDNDGDISPEKKNEGLITSNNAGQTKPSGHASGASISPQALSIFCRIYVGNINFDIHERHLRAIFGSFGFVKSLNMSYDPSQKRHKGFCFIEFDTPEAASMSIDLLDNFYLSGRNLKVGRPSTFPADGTRKLSSAPKTRLYIANIHNIVTEADIKEIFREFGDVKAVSLPPDTAAKRHRGYGFVEYKSNESCNNALSVLNGFELAGKPLRICRCIVNVPIPPGMSSLNILPQSVLSIAEEISKNVQSNSSLK